MAADAQAGQPARKTGVPAEARAGAARAGHAAWPPLADADPRERQHPEDQQCDQPLVQQRRPERRGQHRIAQIQSGPHSWHRVRSLLSMRQPGSRGGAAWAASAALADSMTESTAERCASSFARARRSAAEASARACGLLAASTSATSDCTRSASGDAQVTRPLTTRARRKLASDSVTWYWVRSVSSSLLAGEQLAAPSLAILIAVWVS